MRGNKRINLYDIANEAMSLSSSIETCIVQQRTGHGITLTVGRDLWWHEEILKVDDNCPAEIMDAEDPLFILYTSGSTGTPKGLQHTCGGYMVYTAYSFKNVFQHEENDVYWCTADIGWITGHSYIVYGPLLNGATTLMFEGVPTYPDAGRFWNVVDKHQVNIFYTAPTAIRSFMKFGREIPDQYDLRSLRLLGTVGEPINPEAWMWYREVIGDNKCPIVDTWWQTETGGVMISPLPGAVATKPGSATFSLPGIEVEVVDKNGEKVLENEGGYLIIKKPWPGMMRTIHENSQRYLESYWEYISFKDEKNVYFAGDGARIDNDGYIWIMGRVDDVISVSGHRLGTMEIESALVSHKSVAEAAVVGRKDDLKGEAIVAFVSLEKDINSSSELVEELKKHVINEIGIIAKPEKIIISDSLPKTRSGKIMRRILRSLAEGKKISGDISTLEDSSVLEKLKEIS
jgi:acetyl-CoA synthetase